MGFENILGNKENKKLLTNILETENISHSHMFIGKHSIGKLLFAKVFYVVVIQNHAIPAYLA